MKKSKILTKALLLSAPFILGVGVVMAQTDARAKKPGNKTSIASEKKVAELQNKKNVAQTAIDSQSKIHAKAGARPCVTSVRKNPNEITQAMLNKMPKDRQAFVKAHPERYTILNY